MCVDLPTPLWEEIAGQLTLKDVMALRQAWRGATHLAGERVRAAAMEELIEELSDNVLLTRGAARSALIDGIPDMQEDGDIDDLTWLADWLTGAMEGVWEGNSRNASCLRQQPLCPAGNGVRCTFELQPRGAGCVMQAVVCLNESHDADAYCGQPVEVDLEELRFLTQGGALLAEYGLAWSLDNSRLCLRNVRLGEATGGATGFGRLQPRPMSEAAPHFEALEAAARAQPLRAADGRWADGLLLPATWAAVTEMYCPQLS